MLGQHATSLRRTQNLVSFLIATRLIFQIDWIAAHEGLRVGPEGAAALAAVEQLEAAGAFSPGERVVVFQTGDPANYV